jgi:molybdopterin/thiamine biosynthesis adenylyltransferase
MSHPCDPPDPALSPADAERFARPLRLAEVGAAGQARLRASGVLVVGAGGLGSSALLHLAASGVGRLGIVDPDTVAPDNLHRQLLHGMSEIGLPKTESARRRLAAIDPSTRVETHAVSFSDSNADSLTDAFEIVIDGTDNLAARRSINRACVREGKPMVYGSAQGFEGQLAVFDARFGPCFQCIFAAASDAEIERPSATGVFGPLPGIIGTLQALAAMKILLGAGDPGYGRLITFDGLAGSFEEIKLTKNPNCPECRKGD